MKAFELSWVFPLKAVALPLGLLALSLPWLASHGRPSLGLANQITLARSVLTAVLMAFVGEADAERFVWLLIAGASLGFVLDWVDGRVARATGFASPFGARLDMELDALTILGLCGLAWWLDRAGAWVFWSGALRYVFVAASWIWPWMNRPLLPSKRRPFVCGMQIICLLGALVPWPASTFGAGFSDLWALVGLAALLYSFGVDTAWLVAHRNDERVA